VSDCIAVSVNQLPAGICKRCAKIYKRFVTGALNFIKHKKGNYCECKKAGASISLPFLFTMCVVKLFAAARQAAFADIASNLIRMLPTLWIDHFMLGYYDLAKGIEWFKRHTGIEPVFGGRHPGRGTQNAMVSLSPNVYLEIIAPDPDQPVNVFTEQLEQIKTVPALITWAMATNDIQRLKTEMQNDKISPSDIVEGSRKREDGSTLKWKMFYAKTTDTRYFFPSAIPFFIEWEHTPFHPAQTSPSGCTLLSFTAHHPEATRYVQSLRRSSLNIPFIKDDDMRMNLSINSPQGIVNFINIPQL
jgi:hypothetical protein